MMQLSGGKIKQYGQRSRYKEEFGGNIKDNVINRSKQIRKMFLTYLERGKNIYKKTIA